MIELELKAVVPDAEALVARLRNFAAREEFSGRLVDRRFDYADSRLLGKDEVIRVREYQGMNGETQTSLEWKGPESQTSGYKQREEIGVETGDAETLVAILGHLGLVQVRTIEREIRQFRLDGAVVRLEQYEQMDDLVEVEGEGPDIERAISQMGIPRDEYTADSLAEFARRYEARTGKTAITGKVASA
jgi:predicted adenylyl cyclase CyaB